MADTTIDTLKLQIQVSDKATANLKRVSSAAKDVKKAFTELRTESGYSVKIYDEEYLKLKKIASKINSIGNGRKGGNKSGGVGQALGLGTSVFKIAATIRYTKKLGVAIGKMVQSGMDFTETLNLWQKAMRGNVGEARNFITEMNRAYGISEKTLMQYQATFKNMLSAMSKISEDTAYKLSEAMSRMALDYASLYNVSIEETMSKFQAVLSGQIRPIRTISGYDVSEQSIFGIYQQIGGTKTMRQLDQTEKRMLRILAIFYQMDETKAIGDMAQTLYTNANQFRIMKEQAQEFTMWVGNSVSYLLEESHILVAINSALIVMKELAKGIAYSLGYREETVAQTLFEDMQDANEEAEKFSGLLGFDKFQALKSGSGQGATDIESVLLSAMEKYESMLGKVDNPAMEKAEKVLHGLGLEMTYYANVGEKAFEGTEAEFQKWYDTLTEVEKKQVSVQKVFDVSPITDYIEKVKTILIPFIGVTLVASFVNSFAIIAKVVKFAFAGMGKSMLPFIILATGVGMAVMNIIELVQKWDELSAKERISKALLAIAGAAMAAAAAIGIFKGVATGGVAIASIIAVTTAVTGIMLASKGSLSNIAKFANGGVPQKGSLFYAGEAGAELVTNTGGGKSAVMNMQQLQVAITRGMIAAMSTQSGGTSGSVNLSVDGQSLFSITKGYAKKNGYDFVKVK